MSESEGRTAQTGINPCSPNGPRGQIQSSKTIGEEVLSSSQYKKWEFSAGFSCLLFLVLFGMMSVPWAAAELASKKFLPSQGSSNHSAVVSGMIQEGIKLLQEAKWQEAKKQFESAVRAQPESSEAHEALGQVLLHENQLDWALAEVLEALRLDPKNADAYASLVAVYQRQGNWIEGLKASEKALALNPKLPRLHYHLGKLYLDQLLFGEAAKEFEQVLLLDPKYPSVYVELGTALSQDERYEPAIQAYQKAIAENAYDGRAYRGLGQSYRKKQMLEEAAQAYQKSVELDARDADSYFQLGEIYRKQNKIPEAVVMYGEAVKFKPDFIEAYQKLGPLASEIENWGLATLAYEKIVDAEQSRGEVTPPLLYNVSHLAYLYQRQGRVEEASQTYLKALEMDPSDAVSHYNLGILFQKKGQITEAIAHYEKASELSPEDADFNYALAEAYCIHQDSNAAWKVFEEKFSKGIKGYEKLYEYLKISCPNLAAPESKRPSEKIR